MHYQNSKGSCHLSYCSNIHAGESWSSLNESLHRHVPAIREQLCPAEPFGLGLRISGSACEDLRSEHHLNQLRETLESLNSYVFTLNGFPYGVFHGSPVKEDVYRPDWQHPVRLKYTNELATLLASLLPEGVNGSVSTVPGSYKPWARSMQSIEAIASNMLQHVAHLVMLKERTGKQIVLALEPEPCCLLETIDETIRFFEQYLFSTAALVQLAELTGKSPADCDGLIRQHIGVCYDVCHAAVEFENPGSSIDALRAAGIQIAKLQLSSALQLSDISVEKCQRLLPFNEPVYLHQVVQRKADGTLQRFSDLEAAIAQSGSATGSTWRIHFHVPVFLDNLPGFDTTQSFLADILQIQKEQGISEHMEVETYTWEVLPENLRSGSVADAIARELIWVGERLGVRQTRAA